MLKFKREVMIFRDQRPQFRHPPGNNIINNAANIQIDLLGKGGNAHTRAQPDLTVIGLHLTTDKAQQRRFAFTVAPNQANTLATEHLQFYVVEQRAVPKSQGYPVESQ